MWHYVGGRFAADRYAARMGRRPKNDFRTSLFNCPVGPMVGGLAGPRPMAGRRSWTSSRGTTRSGLTGWLTPGVREVLSWNAVIVLRVAGS